MLFLVLFLPVNTRSSRHVVALHCIRSPWHRFRLSSNDSAKSKPKLYNGGIKDWKDGDRIAVKSYLFSNNLLEVVLHVVAPKASRTVTEQGPLSSDPSGTSTSIGAGTKQSQFITPTAHQDGRRDPSTTASAGGPGHHTYKILLQDGNTTLKGRDGTKIIGPFDAATVIDMLDSGDIDKDSSLISYNPDGFWEAITQDKELEIYKPGAAALALH